MGWIKHSEDNRLPGWLKKDLPTICSVCGSEKENYYNTKGECTNRRCTNKFCPSILAQRVVSMCTILGVKGIGPATADAMIKQGNCKTHFETIPKIFNEKRLISLYQLLRILFIEGIDTQWAALCAPFGSVTEFLANYNGKFKDELLERKEELLYGESLFLIKKAEEEVKAVLSANVMITGNIRGISDRDMFIAVVNQTMKGLVRLQVVGVRKTNVLCLIKEEDAATTRKVSVAKEMGIPILTPSDFLKFIVKEVKERGAVI